MIGVVVFRGTSDDCLRLGDLFGLLGVSNAAAIVIN